MSDLLLLSERQMARIEGYFLLSHGVQRVDDRRVVSRIVYVIRNGLQWKDAPKGYGPLRTLYNRFIRWSRLGVFDRILAGLAGDGPKPERIMIDVTHLKAHRSAASLLKKWAVPRRIGRTKGGLNSKRHTVCDGEGRPLVMLLSEEQMSDHRGGKPRAGCPAAGHNCHRRSRLRSTPFRQALVAKGIEPCIPSSPLRKIAYPNDKALYRQRHRIENLLAKLKD